MTTVKNRLGETSMQTSATSGSTMERIELQEIIVQVHSIDQVVSTRQSIQVLLSLSHKKNDYRQF